MSDLDTPVVYHVACEACRLKKCKCNRVLPVCGQCDKSGAHCVYPQTFKRGFPEGYLAAIETRLIQTERALFAALSSPNGTKLAETSLQLISNVFDTKKTKSARIKEWDRLPLSTAQDWQNWYLEKAETIGLSPGTLDQRRGDVSMDESTSTYYHRNLRSGDVTSFTALWHQPYAHHAILSTGRDRLSEPVQPPHQRVLDSEGSVTPSQQVNTPISSDPVGMRTATTPRDFPSPSKASTLSARQSRRFF